MKHKSTNTFQWQFESLERRDVPTSLVPDLGTNSFGGPDDDDTVGGGDGDDTIPGGDTVPGGNGG